MYRVSRIGGPVESRRNHVKPWGRERRGLKSRYSRQRMQIIGTKPFVERQRRALASLVALLASICRRVHTRSRSGGIIILGGDALLQEAQFRRLYSIRRNGTRFTSRIFSTFTQIRGTLAGRGGLVQSASMSIPRGVYQRDVRGPSNAQRL